MTNTGTENMVKTPLLRHFSAGGAVFKREDGNVLWLVQERAGHAYWQIPKGHIEKGEKSPETAVREVKEESGVDARVITKIDDEKYFFIQDGQRIFKTVSWFLMEYISGSTDDFNPREVSAAKFTAYNEAHDLIKFASEKGILEKAQELLNTGDFESKLA